MSARNPIILIGIGFILVLAGACLPILMVMQYVQSTFLLNFVAYSASVAGLFLGLIGGATYARSKRTKE
jgi:membrane associated rhomboid family serine protease